MAVETIANQMKSKRQMEIQWKYNRQFEKKHYRHQTGNIVYGVIELDQEAINQTKGMELAGGSLMPVPWNAVQTSGKEGVVKPVSLLNKLTNIPGYGTEVNIVDIRAFWELADPLPELQEGEVVESLRYRGSKQFDKAELQKPQQRYQRALENFRNLDVVYRDDVRELERAREQYEEAFLQYSREGGQKTIQQ